MASEKPRFSITITNTCEAAAGLGELDEGVLDGIAGVGVVDFAAPGPELPHPVRRRLRTTIVRLAGI
jgi:hypothetical protein